MEKETIEEFALRNSKYTNHSNINTQKQEAIILGAKWQAERMYSESDKIMKFLNTEKELKLSDAKTIERIKWYFETYFEQFKKK
jgi:predicted RNA-binding protein (virulence factor B family)